MPAYFSVLVVLLLAWGAFAFGAVYDWAYTPLFCGAAAVGVLGWLSPGASERPRVPWALVAALALVGAVVCLQLIPLTPGQIARISPATDRFLTAYDLEYASIRTALSQSANGPPASPAAATYRHPLSIDPSGTRLGLAALAAFALLSIGIARGLGRRGLRVLAVGLTVVGAALALAGLAQPSLGVRDPRTPALIYGFWKPIWGRDPFGPFVNRNHFAGWMLLALPVAIGYFCALVDRGMKGVKPNWRERVLWFSSSDANRVILVGAAITLMGLSLVRTFSRSGISGFLLGVAISVWFVIRRHSKRSKRAVALAYLVLLAALTLGWVGLDAVVGRFAAAQGSELSGRLPIWTDTLTVVRDFPVTGTGLNTYGTSMLIYQEHDLDTRSVEAHNDYLQLVAEGGGLLGIPAIALLLVLLREIRRRFRERADDAMEYWLRVGAATGLAAMAFQETVEFSLQIPGVAALFAVVAAIAIRPGKA